MLKVLKRFPLIPKKPGFYYSFPTLAVVAGELFMAVRVATVDEDEPHGRAGVVSLYKTTAESLEQWPSVRLDSVTGERWEIDAILSAVDDELYLQSRHYRQDFYNKVFFSRLSQGETPPSLREVDRRALSSLQPCLSASYGHLVRAADGALLLPAYGGLSKSGITSPLLFHSYNGGVDWQLRAVLADSDLLEKYLNEYSMLNLGGKRWLALMRDNHKPSILWQLYSEDDGFSWSELTDSGLRGHAPMLCAVAGGVVAIYRELSPSTHGIGFAYRVEGSDQWVNAAISRDYSGALYNGGYGDVVALAGNRLFAAYYVADGDQSPWIEGAVLSWGGEGV
ncbi:MAG: glycoside hydrolase [Gammaproteobacteria bacterium]|nr:glycoside hydrolase [Gammaproteobacteria bacterium]MCF6230170.1 glycoside hydrolase [Gammaproteobacteria bacterium]